MARYIESAIDNSSSKALAEEGSPKPVTPADHWVIAQANRAIHDISTLLEKYRFSEAYERLYHVIWDDVADWYIESSKIDYSASTLVWVLQTCLKLAHPFAPFVTETIWQTLEWTKGELITETWPKTENYSSDKAQEFSEIQAIVSESRHLTSALGSKEIAIMYEDDGLIESNAELIRSLSRVTYVTKSKEGHALRLLSTPREAWFDISEEQIKNYKSKIIEEIHKTQDTVQNLRRRLANKSYVTNAPKELVEQSREELASIEEQIIRLDNELANLQNS
jgi:valyl-tRNA synthetase